MFRSFVVTGLGAVLVCACGQGTAATSSSAAPASASAAATPTASVAATTPASSCPPAAVTPAAQPTAVAESPLPAQRLVASIPIQYAPGALTEAAGSVWVAAHRSTTVFRVDPARNAVVASIPITTDAGIGPVIANGPHGLWLPTGDRLMRLDPASNTVATTFPLAAESVVDTAAGVFVGTSDLHHPAVVQVDPVTGKTLRTIPAGPGSHDLRFAFGSLWVVSRADVTGRVDDQSTSFVRVDPATGVTIANVALPTTPDALAAGDDGLYVSLHDLTIARIDPATNCIAAIAYLGRTIDPDNAPGAPLIQLFPTSGLLYVGYDRGALAVLDPRTLAVRSAVRIDTQDHQGGVILAFGSVWFSGFGTDLLQRIRPSG